MHFTIEWKDGSCWFDNTPCDPTDAPFAALKAQSLTVEVSGLSAARERTLARSCSDLAYDAHASMAARPPACTHASVHTPARTHAHRAWTLPRARIHRIVRARQARAKRVAAEIAGTA